MTIDWSFDSKQTAALAKVARTLSLRKSALAFIVPSSLWLIIIDVVVAMLKQYLLSAQTGTFSGNGSDELDIYLDLKDAGLLPGGRS